MTVKELITLLEQEDPTASVWVDEAGYVGSALIKDLVNSWPGAILLGLEP